MRPLFSWMLLVSCGVATAATDVPDSSALNPHGVSYWGVLPTAAEAPLFEPTARGSAAWEVPIDLTYDLIRLPFRALTWGAKQTVVFLDESNTFYHLQRLMGDVSLPYGFRVGGVTDQLAGPGVAVNFYHDALGGPGRRLQLKTQTSLEHNHRASLGYVFPVSDDSEVGIGAGYRKRPNARFFGIGPHSREEDKSYYTQEVGWAGVEYSRALAAGLSTDLDVVYSSVSARDAGESDLRSLDPSDFAGESLLGFGESSQGVEFSVGLTHDTTSQSARPASGGLRRLQAGWFRSSDVGGSHVSLRAEAQHFFSLWWDRTLAVRGAAGFLESEDDTPHFARLMTNTDPDTFRGYDDHRWRDQGLLLFNVEYRYPVWVYRAREGTGVDGYLFFDTGQVFSEDERPALRDFVHNYGGGFRFVGARGFGARAELAASREDLLFRLSLDQVFQYPKNALYHGRQPIPLR